MTNICNFCLKTFKNTYTLKNHQETASYCLKIQDKIVHKTQEKIRETKKTFDCKACEKIFTTKNSYLEHLKICKEIKNQDIKKLTLKIDEKDKELEELKIKFEEQKIEINNLKFIIEFYKSDHILVQEMAKEPKNTNTNTTINNKYLSLAPLSLTKSEIKEQVNNNFLIENFLRGQEGVADFAYNNFLLDDEGNSKYLCNDVNRYTFTYKTKDGELNKDYKANNLTNLICADVINKSSIISKTGIENSEDYNDKVLYVKNMEEIKNLKDNNSKFAKQLSILTTSKINMILQEENTEPFIEQEEDEEYIESCSEDENNELLPLYNKYMEEKSEILTIEHIKEGVNGFIDFGLKNVFNNRLKYDNNGFIYIDKFNRLTIDKTGDNICERFFKAMYRKTFIECEKYENELKNKLKKEFKNETIDTIQIYENIHEIKKYVCQIKKGETNSFLEEFICTLIERLK